MRKQDVITVEDTIKYYNQVRPIRFEDEVEIKNVQDICQRTMNYRKGDNIKTVYTRGGAHCPDDRIRSLDDIFKLAIYYFPGIKLGEVLKELMIYEEDQAEANNYALYYSYCPDIRKSNFSLWERGYGQKFTETIEGKRPSYDYKIARMGFVNATGYIYDLLDS